MKFQDSDIQKLASLARIELSEHDTEKFRDQLSSVIEYVDQITAITTHDEEAGKEDPMLREDIPAPAEATPQALLDAAPQTEEGHMVTHQVK